MYSDHFYEQRENLDYRDRQLPNPLKTIGAGAFSLLAFIVIRGAALRGSSAASKSLARNLPRVLRSVAAPKTWIKSYKNLRAAAIRSSRAEAKQFGILSPKDIGIAATVKEVPLIQRARAKFTTIFAKQIEARRQYYYRDLGLREKELYAALKEGYHPRALDQRLKALKTFMKPDGAFSARFMAAAGKWGERYAKMIPGFYVADQALGLFEKERPEHPKPAWYNIPGHVAGMVRFGIGFAPIDLAFSGARHLFRYGRAVSARGAQLGVREFPHVREKFAKTVETLHIKGAQWHASISKHWAARRHGAWPSIQELKRSIKERKAPHSMDIVRLYSDIVKDAKIQRKPYFKMEQQLNQILGVLGMRKDPEMLREMSKDTEIKKAFHEVLGKFERRPKQTFIEYALKTPERPADWAPRRLSTTSYIKRYAKEAQWDPETTNNVLKLLGGKELYYGKNILRKGNFSMFNASFTAGKVIDVMGKWKLPFINWHPFERMMITGIPKIGIPSKGSAFRILDEKQSALMAEAAIDADLNITRSPQLKIGEYFMRIGDHVFRFSPEKLIKRISGHWKVGVDTITAGERRYFQGMVESQTDYEHTGWLGHLRQKFELGRSPHFIGRRLKEYIIQDFNPESPHVLMHEKGKFAGMLERLQGDKIFSPREQKEFINYSRAIGRHLYGSEQNALELFHNNQGLRGKVLDILGGADAKKAKKILNDVNIDKVIDDLSMFDYALPEIYSQRTVQEVRRALHDVQNLVGADREFLLRSRATVVGQASNLSVQDYLMGQYFKKTLENYSKVGKITEDMYDKIFKSIDDAIVSKSEKSKAKSLFASMKINRPMSEHLNVYSDQEVINSLDTVGHLKDIISPNENLLRDVFKLDYRSLRESAKINRFMRDTLIPLEIRGYMGPINEIWRIQGHGVPSAPKDLFGAAPGFGDMITSSFNKFFRISDSATQINYEPYITKQSMLLHRWAIRPFNMTLGWIGLDLQYRSNAEFMKKFAMKRALAIPAAIYGYRAIDTFLTVNPLLNHTIFDDGLTSAGAQIIGKANVARAEVFDTLGITDKAQYLEGLMPGSMESPAAKLFRAAALPILGRKFGGGPGLMIGLGASAATGFGLPDLTRSADELRDVYSGRKLVPHRSGRYWETCVTHCPIMTYNGIKYPEEIIVGDKIKTFDGSVGKILAKSERKLIPNETVYNIKTSLPFKVELTGNHELYILRNDELRWIPTENIMTTDLLAIPFHKRTYKRKNLWLPNILDCSKIWTEGEILYPMQFKSCWSKSTKNGIPASIPLTREFGRLIGYYLGDGNVFNNVGKAYGIEFCFDKHEIYYAEDVQNIIHEIFGLKCTIRRKGSGYIIVRCLNTLVGQLFETIFTRKKIVPEFIYNISNSDFHRGIIEGLWESDGSVDKTGTNIQLSLVNPNIILYAFEQLLRLGIIPTFRKSETNYESLKKLNPIKKQYGETYHLYIPSKYRVKFWKNIHIKKEKKSPKPKQSKIKDTCLVDDKYYYISILDKQTIQYDDLVYDFMVDHNFSYCGPTCTYHNSKLSYFGGRIRYFEPSWYTKIVSQYKYTDAALGTKLESLLYTGPLSVLTDPYHFEREHFFDRPYPTTAGLFSDVPVIGSIADMTIGRLLKPQVMMHEDELEAAQMGFDVESKNRILPGYNKNTMPPLHEARPGYFAPRHTIPSVSMKGMLGDSFYRLTEAAGLRGFMTQAILGREGIGQYAPVYDDASAITSFGHQFWDAEIGGGIMCFDGSTLISTTNGYKKICDIKPEMQIVNLSGIYKIKNKFKRIPNDDDEMYEISVNSHPNKIKVTGNHKVLAHRTKCHWKSEKSHRPNNNGICPYCNKKFVEHLKEIRVCDLRLGDFLITPIPIGQNEYIIDFAKYMPIFTDDFVYSQGSKEFFEIYERLQLDGNLQYSDFHDQRYYDAKKSTGNHKKWIRYLQLNEDLCYLIGWWIAEGCIQKSTMHLIMHKDEIGVAHKLGNIAKRLLGIENYYIRSNGENCISLYFSHRPFVNFLKAEFGYGSHNKYISHDIKQMKNEYVSALLKGLMEGDGWENESKGGFTTVSQQLLLDMIELFAKLGKLPHAYSYYEISKNGEYPQGGKRKPTLRYYLKYNKNTRGRFHNFIFNNKLYKKITKIEQIDCPRFLYDLEIEDVHQYQANGIIAHNSEAWRRLYPRERFKNLVNPIRNLAPNWLPEEFKTGDPYCIGLESLIDTENGLIKAKDVSVNDRLKTHDGSYRRIMAEKIRNLKQNEFAYEFRITGLPAIPSTIFSEDHPILGLKNYEIKQIHNRKYGQKYYRKMRNAKCYNLKKLPHPKWIKTKDLNPGDYVAYPIPQYEEKNIIIDMAKYTKFKYTDRWIYPKHCHPEIYEYFLSNPCPYNIQQLAIEFNVEGSTLDAIRDHIKAKRYAIRYPRYIEFDEDLAALCGYYAAEGWAGNNGEIGFALHVKEKSTIVKYLDHIFKKFINRSGEIYQYERNGNGIDYRIGSGYLADFLGQIGHEAHEKHIPKEFFHLHKSYLIPLIKAYFEGDGCYFSDGKRARFSAKSVSLQLLYDIRNILLSWGIISNINYDPGGRTSKIGNQIIHAGISYSLNINSENALKLAKLFQIKLKCNSKMLHSYSFIYDGYLCMRVNNKQKVSCDQVIGFEIENDSFCVLGIATHNTHIKGGLILLPSRAHEKMYHVKHNFPIDLEYFGYEPGEAAGRLLKLIRPEREEEYHYSFIKELIQKQLLMNRQLLSKDVPLFNPWSKIEGHVDAIIMNQSGIPELMQIKATTAEKLGFMQQPKPAHVSQLNFAMRQMKKRYGQILYVASDNPELSKSFYIEYNSERFRNDMSRINEARELASDMLLKGIGQVGESYSYPDRLQILANVSPWAPEYKKVLKQCRLLKSHGLLDEEDQVKVDEARRQHDAIMRKFDFYPHRFSHGKWLTPDPTYNLMSQNENIKTAAKYNIIERLMGAAYERLLEFDIPVVHSKLLPYYTPEQMYERQIGGSFSGQWSRPIHDYIKPWWHSFLLSTNPVASAIKLGFAGGVSAGPPGAAVGLGAGLLYGAGRSVAGPGTWVPKEVRKTREIDEYFDALEYIKNRQLYEQTGDPEYLKRSRETIYGVTPMSTPAEFYRSVPYMERPFFWSFASIQDKIQQDRIKQRISPTMRKLLEHYWSGEKKFTNPMIEDYNPNFRMPAEDWMGWREDIPLEDIQLKTVKMEGLDCFIPTQKLLTLNGPIEIQNVEMDTELVNAQGKLKTPICIFRKFYKGEMIKLDFKGTYFDLTGTKTHELEIAKKCRKFVFKKQKLQDVRKYNRLKLYGYNFPETCKKFDDIKISKDLGFILGWFLAEGSYVYNPLNKQPKGIVFSLNILENDIAKKLQSKINKIFGCNVSIHERTSSTSGNPYLQVTSFSVKMARFIYKLINPNAKTKYLHPIVFKFPIPILEEIIRQWFNGDGWKTNKEVCVCTASEKLAIQGWYIMRSCGMEAAIQKAKQYGYKPGFNYRIRIGRKKDKEIFYSNWKYVPWTTLTVSKIYHVNYEGDIYDVEMPNNHYYTTICGTVHNSHDFGLGWKPQELRMHNSPYAVKPIDISSPSGISYGHENLESADVKNFVQNILQRYGITNTNVAVTKSQGSGATISLNIN